MNVKANLLPGATCELTCDHTYPLAMSPFGGVPSNKVLEVKAGTRVMIAENYQPCMFDIPFNFVEEELKKYGGPFFTPRPFLQEVRPS